METEPRILMTVLYIQAKQMTLIEVQIKRAMRMFQVSSWKLRVERKGATRKSDPLKKNKHTHDPRPRARRRGRGRRQGQIEWKKTCDSNKK